MHAECYAGTTFATPRHPGGRAIGVTLLLSIVLHLILWRELALPPHASAATTPSTTLAVTLLAAQPSKPAEPVHKPKPHPAPVRETVVPISNESVSEPSSASNEPSAPEVSAATAEQTLPALVTEPPQHHAAYLHNPEPSYPLVARRRHLEGTVVIRAQVGTSGECLTTALQQSSGHAILDEVALQTVSQWRFVPARRGDETVVAWVDVPITFRLTGR